MARGEGRQWLSVCVFILLTVVLGSSVNAQQEVEEENEHVAVVWFYPEELKLITEGKTVEVTWFTNATGIIETVEARMMKSMEAEVADFSEPFRGAPLIDANATDFDLSNVTYHGFVNVTAKFVGFNTLLVNLYDERNETAATGLMDLTVKLKTDKLTSIFTYVNAVLTGFAYLLMGATLDLQVVKGIAKRPVGPIIGMFCQYVLMPVISFGLGLALFPEDNFDSRLLRLGMFLGGCCPGGGASNMWTHLLGGSLDLSIMMTGISTFVSFGSVPLWVFSLGPVIINDATFVIPYRDITITVFSLIIPCGIGIALQARYPKSKLVKICAKIMSPVFALNVIVIFTFGVYAYSYVFSIYNWRMLVAGFALPALGYTAGVTLAVIFRMDTPRIIAIGVETGVQNYNIAIIILLLTMASPAGEIANVMPAAFTLFTPLPLLILLIGRKTYQWVRGRFFEDPTSSSTDLKDVPTKNSVSKDVVQHHNGVDNKGGGIDNFAADLTDKL